MARSNEDRTALELQGVRRRIDVWRWTRLKRSPMPEDLWIQATKLADAHGVWRTARELGLCYESLKRRVEEKASRKQAGAVRFVEVRAAELMDQTSSNDTVVELHATDGTRMTVRLGSGAQVDLQTLVASFRRHVG